MNIAALYRQKKPVISFEVFPPKLDTPIESIYEKLGAFAALSPDYMSVTYGAGGSKKGRTLDIVEKLQNDHQLPGLAHFTCVGQSLDEINELLARMKASGLTNILALRGDPPIEMPDFDFSKNVFAHASDLIAHIKTQGDFCIGAAAYPEGHQDSKRLSEDLKWLKYKVDSGIDFLVTQLFFDNRVFFDFQDKCTAIGIECPLVPGIMPIFKADQIKRIALMCGASFPARLVTLLDKYADNAEDMTKAGIEYAATQISELIASGVPGIHLLTMNRVDATASILKLAGIGE